MEKEGNSKCYSDLICLCRELIVLYIPGNYFGVRNILSLLRNCIQRRLTTCKSTYRTGNVCIWKEMWIEFQIR